MKKLIEEHYSNYKSTTFSFYFTQFREEQEAPIVLEQNTIYVKGKEAYLSILDKTIKAIQFINTIDQYDFLIRSNTSTVIDINNLNKFVLMLPQTNIFCGGMFLKFHLMGINFNFYQGTGIIFSKDVIDFICSNTDKLNYSIIDDLAFGLFVNQYCSDKVVTKEYNATLTSNGIPTEHNNKHRIIFYRNKSDNRIDDIKRMELIIKHL
jgi:hypothetical protein